MAALGGETGGGFRVDEQPLSPSLSLSLFIYPLRVCECVCAGQITNRARPFISQRLPASLLTLPPSRSRVSILVSAKTLCVSALTLQEREETAAKYHKIEKARIKKRKKRR